MHQRTARPMHTGMCPRQTRCSRSLRGDWKARGGTRACGPGKAGQASASVLPDLPTCRRCLRRRFTNSPRSSSCSAILPAERALPAAAAWLPATAAAMISAASAANTCTSLVKRCRHFKAIQPANKLQLAARRQALGSIPPSLCPTQPCHRGMAGPTCRGACAPLLAPRLGLGLFWLGGGVEHVWQLACGREALKKYRSLDTG